jgi:GLPGLI family protein
MKTNILILIMIFLPLAVKSQDPTGNSAVSGKLIYQEKIKLEIKLEGDAAQLAGQIPSEQITGKVLFFNPDYSLYQPTDKVNEDQADMGHQGGVMKIRMVNGGENDKIFCDFKKGKRTEQKEFMTRMFLVESDISTALWKLTGNYQNILGYNCQEAVSEDTTRKVRAWFTTSIPVSSGPAGYGGLPGMILKTDINNGKRIITATTIEPSLNDSGILTAPKEGRKVTSDEFKKIVDDKMKEMGVENGGGTNHIVIKIKN